MNDLEMRRVALTMASNNHEPPEAVVERAERYYQFLKKTDAARAHEQPSVRSWDEQAAIGRTEVTKGYGW